MARDMEGASVTEGTTRTLPPPFENTAQTQGQNFKTAETAHLVTIPSATSLPTAPITQDFQAPLPPRRRTVLLLSLALSGVLLLAFAALLGLWYSGRSAAVNTPPPVISVQPPVPPPAPPPLPGSNAAGTIPNRLMYPNATVTQQVVSVGSPSMMQLTSADSFERILAWYEERLEASEKVITPGANAVLRSSEATVIIMSDGSESQIMITGPEER